MKDFDWDRFQLAATNQVRGGIGEQLGVERLFQFLSLSSFDSVIGWEALKRHKPSADHPISYAVRTEWERRADWKRLEECKVLQPPVARPRAMQALTPTIQQRTVSVEAKDLEAFLSELKHIRIPPFTFEHGVGCDGTSYELSFGRYFLSAEYRWWEEGAKEWKPMVERVMTFVDWLEEQPELRNL